jgi:hypothetical protein
MPARHASSGEVIITDGTLIHNPFVTEGRMADADEPDFRIEKDSAADANGRGQ